MVAVRAESVPATGAEHPALKPLDDMMFAFMQEHQVPGAALAVTRNGTLVYSRGFGYADVEKKEPVAPEALFRIASISKPITAVAVLKLVEEGKLALEDRIFQRLGLTPTGDPRMNEITLRQLLQHTGGWDRDVSFDPMFRSLRFAKALNVPPPATAAQVIENMLKVKLDFAPGERYAYSNFGYCLLGRAIEKVSGQTYEAYVREQVLAPLGIRGMRIGATLAEGRAAGEVRYFPRGAPQRNAVFAAKLGEKVPAAYGAWHLEAMDSHGGWIASAPDLVRFAAALDVPERCPILKAGSITTLFARPPAMGEGKAKAVYYGCGWQVRRVGNGGLNTWHNGRLDGTSTLLVRRHDGLCWAVLFNGDENAKGEELSGLIDPRVHQAVDAVKDWPAK